MYTAERRFYIRPLRWLLDHLPFSCPCHHTRWPGRYKLFKEGFRKLLSQEWNSLKKTIDKEFSLSKKQAKAAVPEKTIGCLYQQTTNKTEFKEIKDREIAHRCLYWFTLNPELHPVFSETLRKSTKKPHLDHLHHNEESDLEHLKTHTLLGQHTNTKIVDLDPLKNTQPISANTQTKLVSQSTRITLLTKDNLKSIQAESYSTHFWSITNSKQSQLFEKTQNLYSKNLVTQICFSEYIQRCCLLSNLNKLLNCI